jgi:WD40 repeat protein
VSSGEVIANLSVDRDDIFYPNLEFSSDGKILAVCTSCKVILWDITMERVLGIVYCTGGSAFTISLDSSLFASLSGTVVKVWKIGKPSRARVKYLNQLHEASRPSFAEDHRRSRYST